MYRDEESAHGFLVPALGIRSVTKPGEIIVDEDDLTFLVTQVVVVVVKPFTRPHARSKNVTTLLMLTLSASQLMGRKERKID